METIERIHHISAIVGSAKENIHFYRNVLQLRLIKQTVNFDDPSVYHLYFGSQDQKAVITFFPWESAHQGRKGGGQIGRIAFRVPKGSLPYWQERLSQFNVAYERNTLFGLNTLNFYDMHRLSLALVESDIIADTPNILDFHGAVLLSQNPKETIKLLTEELGLLAVGRSEHHAHFVTNSKVAHRILVPTSAIPAGRWGVGTVHHLAWSLSNEQSQLEWQNHLAQAGYGVTKVKDRYYFKAVYMQEPGGIIHEFATVPPGFTIDESEAELGTQFKLPPQYEVQRNEIEKNLTPL